VRTRTLGPEEVSAIGLGEMQLSLADRPDEAQGIRTIHAALDAGVTLIDTADAYCADGSEMGHGERLTAKALRSYKDTAHVLVATKGGHTRDARGGWHVDGSAGYLRRACDASLAALGVETIDLYQHHRPDPDVPYAESIGTLRELRDEGKIRHVAVSNVNMERLAIARGIVEIAAVQNQYSLTDRRAQDVLEECERSGIGFVPWAPLDAGALPPGGPVDRIAERHGATPMQIALAWLLHASPAMLPIPGTGSLDHLEENVAAAEIELSADDMRELDTLAA
jgi:aryl-alcohol dehydrogenase-like predicted oxidoreductase